MVKHGKKSGWLCLSPFFGCFPHFFPKSAIFESWLQSINLQSELRNTGHSHDVSIRYTFHQNHVTHQEQPGLHGLDHELEKLGGLVSSQLGPKWGFSGFGCYLPFTLWLQCRLFEWWCTDMLLEDRRIDFFAFLYYKIGRRETTRTYQLINLSLKQLNLTSFQIFSIFGKGKLQHNFNSPGDLTAPPPRAISSFASPPTERLAGLVHCCSLSREEAAFWEMAASEKPPLAKFTESVFLLRPFFFVNTESRGVLQKTFFWREEQVRTCFRSCIAPTLPCVECWEQQFPTVSCKKSLVKDLLIGSKKLNPEILKSWNPEKTQNNRILPTPQEKFTSTTGIVSLVFFSRCCWRMFYWNVGSPPFGENSNPSVPRHNFLIHQQHSQIPVRPKGVRMVHRICNWCFRLGYDNRNGRRFAKITWCREFWNPGNAWYGHEVGEWRIKSWRNAYNSQTNSP